MHMPPSDLAFIHTLRAFTSEMTVLPYAAHSVHCHTNTQENANTSVLTLSFFSRFHIGGMNMQIGMASSHPLLSTSWDPALKPPDKELGF